MSTSTSTRATHVARLLAARRADLGMTLDEVCRKATERGTPMHIPTLWRIERGRLDPGVRRLNVLLDIYGIAPDLASELASLDSMVEDLPTGDLFALHQEAKRAWEHGDVSRTLACAFGVLLQVARTPEERLERQKALLFSAIAARGSGRLRLAKHIVDDLLCDSPDPSMLCDILTLAAGVWRANGSIEVGVALIRQAKTHVNENDRRRRARVLHQEAKLLLESGQIEAAATSLNDAIDDYRAVGETLNEARSLILRIAVLEKLGRLDDAIACARDAAEFCNRSGHALVTTHAYLELGRVLTAAGRPKDALVELRRALASAQLLKDRNAEFHAHENLAAAYEALGEKTTAEEERRLAEAIRGGGLRANPPDSRTRDSAAGRDTT